MTLEPKIALRLQFLSRVVRKECKLFVPEEICLERLFQRLMKGGQFAGHQTPMVGRLRYLIGVSDSLAYRVARQTRALCDFM